MAIENFSSVHADVSLTVIANSDKRLRVSVTCSCLAHKSRKPAGDRSMNNRKGAKRQTHAHTTAFRTLTSKNPTLPDTAAFLRPEVAKRDVLLVVVLEY